MSKHLLFGMGIPHLDLLAHVKPEFLTKYGLNANDDIICDKQGIFPDLNKNYKVEYIAGGATQNSIRAAQWILHDKPNCTVYFGCVGKDNSAEILKEQVAKDKVDAKYQVTEEYITGRCAVLITGKDRSLVSKLEAANEFTVDHLDADDNWQLVEECDAYYSAGFFLTVCPEAMIRVGKYAAEKGKYFAFNLSAPFLPEFLKNEMLSVLPHANLVFGNGAEVEAFANANDFKVEGRNEMAKKIAQMPLTGHKSRIVCITQGADDVILVDETGDVKTFNLPKVPGDEIVDTNGVGDAFVGGFLAQLVLKKSLSDCVKCGIWASAQVIRQSGCTFPDKRYEETDAEPTDNDTANYFSICEFLPSFAYSPKLLNILKFR